MTSHPFRFHHLRGISTLAVVAVLAAAAIGFTWWTSYQKNQARAAHEAAVAAANTQMDKLKAQWVDALQIASATPRMGLAGPMGTLQSIRQSAQALDVPECLAPNKQHLTQGMTHALEGMLAFMRNDMEKFALQDFVASKAQAMNDSFALYDKKPAPCAPAKS